MGAIRFAGEQVLPLVPISWLSIQLMGTSLDLLVGKSPPWPSPLHQPWFVLSPLHPLFLFTGERSQSAHSLYYKKQVCTQRHHLHPYVGEPD